MNLIYYPNFFKVLYTEILGSTLLSNKDKNAIDVYLCSMYKDRQNSVVNPYLDVRSLDCLGNEVYVPLVDVLD